MVNWTDDSSEICLNPRFDTSDYQHGFDQLIHYLPGHIWLTTSGSTAKGTEDVKWVGISKKAFLISANAVNQHLQSQATDRWGAVLPDFHVGGLGVWARGYLSGAEVIDFKVLSPKWNAFAFTQFINDSKITLTSLVPTQIFDLINLELTPPISLRAVVVGGGSLDSSVYLSARLLGWPLLPSYGLTECSSQVATATLESLTNREAFPSLKLLPHIEVINDSSGKILIKSKALLTTYAFYKPSGFTFRDPKENDWFGTSDLGLIEGTDLTINGRFDDLIKIGGETVNLGKLERILNEIKLSLKNKPEVALVAIPDPRLGHVIHLAVEESKTDGLHTLLEEFHKRVMPFEKIREVHFVNNIPRSPLKKLLKSELLLKIQSLA